MNTIRMRTSFQILLTVFLCGSIVVASEDGTVNVPAGSYYFMHRESNQSAILDALQGGEKSEPSIFVSTFDRFLEATQNANPDRVSMFMCITPNSMNSHLLVFDGFDNQSIAEVFQAVFDPQLLQEGVIGGIPYNGGEALSFSDRNGQPLFYATILGKYFVLTDELAILDDPAVTGNEKYGPCQFRFKSGNEEFFEKDLAIAARLDVFRESLLEYHNSTHMMFASMPLLNTLDDLVIVFDDLSPTLTKVSVKVEIVGQKNLSAIDSTDELQNGANQRADLLLDQLDGLRNQESTLGLRINKNNPEVGLLARDILVTMKQVAQLVGATDNESIKKIEEGDWTVLNVTRPSQTDRRDRNDAESAISFEFDSDSMPTIPAVDVNESLPVSQKSEFVDGIELSGMRKLVESMNREMAGQKVDLSACFIGASPDLPSVLKNLAGILLVGDRKIVLEALLEVDVSSK